MFVRLPKLIAYDIAKVLIDVCIGFILIYILAQNFNSNSLTMLVAGAVGATIQISFSFYMEYLRYLC